LRSDSSTLPSFFLMRPSGQFSPAVIKKEPVVFSAPFVVHPFFPRRFFFSRASGNLEKISLFGNLVSPFLSLVPCEGILSTRGKEYVPVSTAFLPTDSFPPSFFFFFFFFFPQVLNSLPCVDEASPIGRIVLFSPPTPFFPLVGDVHSPLFFFSLNERSLRTWPNCPTQLKMILRLSVFQCPPPSPALFADPSRV